MPKLPLKKRRVLRGPADRSTTLAHLDVVLGRAQTLLDEGRQDEALTVLEANLARLGQFAPVRAMLASVLIGQGSYLEAAVHARLALDLDPRPRDYYLLAVMAYMGAGYYSFACRARRQWLQWRPPDHPLLADMRRFEEEYRRSTEEVRDRYGLRDAKVAEEAGRYASWMKAGGRWTGTNGKMPCATPGRPPS